MKIAHFNAYGTIGENDPYFKVFTGESDPVISSQKVTDFLNANADADEIIVHINSRGGSVDEGFAIHDLLVNSGKKITTRVEGQASSIASVVLMAGSVRQITENSTVMIHNPWINPTIMAGLEADEIIKIGNDMKQAETRILDFYVNSTGGTKDQIESFMKEETTFNADTAVELKFATEILKPVKALAFMNFKPNNETMKNLKELFAPLNAKIDELTGKLNIKAEAAPVVETPVETPAPVEVVASTEPTLEEQLAALKAENETLKQQLSDKEKEATDVLAEINAKYETLAKSIKSDFTVPSGQTDFSRTPKGGQPVNRVEEARRIRAEKAAQMKAVK